MCGAGGGVIVCVCAQSVFVCVRARACVCARASVCVCEYPCSPPGPGCAVSLKVSAVLPSKLFQCWVSSPCQY